MNYTYLKELYRELLLYKEMRNKISAVGHDVAAIDEKIIEVKRKIRSETKKKGYEDFCKIYRKNDYPAVSFYFDKEFDSREEAKEWAEELWKDGQIYADYSPTGQWFVQDVRVAHIEGNRYRVLVVKALDC